MKSAGILFVGALTSLTACVAPDAPETVVTAQGQTALSIYTSMQATGDPSANDLAKASETLKGAGRGNLADRASAQCPSGYKITGQTEPQSKLTMVMANGVPLYRIEQRFQIACQ
jgi:hypothetical protein